MAQHAPALRPKRDTTHLLQQSQAASSKLLRPPRRIPSTYAPITLILTAPAAASGCNTRGAALCTPCLPCMFGCRNHRPAFHTSRRRCRSIFSSRCICPECLVHEHAHCDQSKRPEAVVLNGAPGQHGTQGAAEEPPLLVLRKVDQHLPICWLVGGVVGWLSLVLSVLVVGCHRRQDKRTVVQAPLPLSNTAGNPKSSGTACSQTGKV